MCYIYSFNQNVSVCILIAQSEVKKIIAAYFKSFCNEEEWRFPIWNIFFLF